MKKKGFGKIERLVIKIGSALLFSKGEVDADCLHRLTQEISLLKKQGIQVILVASGAIACGMKLLGLRSRPTSLPEAQAAAAVGQAKLMKYYDDDLRHKGFLTSQVLLTQDDLRDRKRYWNARNTLLALLRFQTIPIVNENDTVATEEISLGDNDQLSSMVACLVGADLLVILSDIDGLYQDFEKKERRLVERVEKIDSEVERFASDIKGEFSKGGMRTKLQAAKIAMKAGIPTVIANGKKEDVLLKIISGESVGTLFLPREVRMGARKSWIAFHSRPKGKIIVDEGAKNALLHQGRSLLSSGVVGAREEFSAGEVISVVDEKEGEFARGLINYSSEEIRKIQGLKSDRIASILGYKSYDEVIHRDNLVIL